MCAAVTGDIGTDSYVYRRSVGGEGKGTLFLGMGCRRRL